MTHNSRKEISQTQCINSLSVRLHCGIRCFLAAQGYAHVHFWPFYAFCNLLITYLINY